MRPTPHVAMISLLFIVMAILFGFFVYRKGASLAIATVAGVHRHRRLPV